MAIIDGGTKTPDSFLDLRETDQKRGVFPDPTTYQPHFPELFQTLLVCYRRAMNAHVPEEITVAILRLNTHMATLKILKREEIFPNFFTKRFSEDICEMRRIIRIENDGKKITPEQNSLCHSMNELEIGFDRK